MRQLFLFISLMTLLVSAESSALQAPLKVLHLAFHRGCLKDIEDVAKVLGVNVTSWFIQETPREEFDGETRFTNDIYNITHERAAKIWEINKDYFESFDVIITSDTAPLARIFLQNGWRKPLIIWVCNRFDYADAQSQAVKDSFPDEAYYDWVRKAMTMSNVRVVAYTKYEQVYASRKNVDIGSLMINPIGRAPVAFNDSQSHIPKSIDKSKYLFLYPRLDNEIQVEFIKQSCAQVGLETYHGGYNGPEDLLGFRGVLYFPYAWSNLALFEDLQQGIVHFVPSESFLKELGSHVRTVTMTEFELCDWWSPEFRDFLIYFDSWDDLKHKIDTTDFESFSAKVRNAGASHRVEMIRRWRALFDELASTVSVN